MKTYASSVKRAAISLGADLCGIAPIDRFQDAPEGFHPQDALPDCQSVIVVAIRFPAGTLEAASTIPYTVVRNVLSAEIDRLTVKLCRELEDAGSIAVPVGSIGPVELDARTDRYRGIVSLRHAGVLAGLGKLGKSTLLINDRYGHMIWLGGVLTTAELPGDPLATYEVCPESCSLCVDACPASAIDGVTDQRRCWEHAYGTHEGGDWRIKCCECRKICPHSTGISNPR